MTEREASRNRDSTIRAGASGAANPHDDVDLGTALEGTPEETVTHGPGGANTIGGGRATAELGNVGRPGLAPDNTSGSEAGLGGGRGDLGGGGGLGDDLGDLAEDTGDASGAEDKGSSSH
jgi:hypothetical protein